MSGVHPQAKPFFLPGSKEVALLFIHGFTASPSEVYPVAQLLNQQAGFTVKGLLLPGHGSTPRHLNETGWGDWFGAVEKELVNLASKYEQVVTAGLSLGALLALHAGVTIPGVKAVVSINAPIFNRYPLLTFLAPVIGRVKPYFPKGQAKSINLEKQGRFAYRVNPVKAFRSMMELRSTVMGEVQKLTVPLLLMQALEDESVHPRSANFIASRVEHNQVKQVMLSKSGHIATMGKEKDYISQEIIKFISKINGD
ncbi:alpha/beta hydrolase [Syntrophomonas erecta subsp. sporosyntropha]